ncbi:hypothetical protein K439DRAFT_1392804 [Ramaria rubella]|nr:hypothetical protein K439DRAFT_1392804 [Ramaria rubella]
MFLLQIFRTLSTKIPRPRNWRTSPSDAPQSLMTPHLSFKQVPPPVTQLRRPFEGSTPREWAQHRVALRKAFPGGWCPPRKISRDAMDSLRMLHRHSPETFTTPVLAQRFKVSPEAVRRILRSRWVPSKERKDELRTKYEAKKVERKRQRVRKEWSEGVEKGMLRYNTNNDTATGELELT